MCIDSHSRAKQILEDYQPHMEPELMALLEFLLLSKDHVNFGDYVDWVLDQDHQLVSKSITSLWNSQLEDHELRKWRNLFEFLYEKDSVRFQKVHQLDTRNLV